jgi:glucokinase
VVSPVPVLEIGGSHVTAALVDTVEGTLLRHARGVLDGGADAETLLAAIAGTASGLGLSGRTKWGVALPGPFDYARGIGLFRGVGKFDALNGVDVGAALRERIVPRPTGFRFLGDAIAFGLGEWAYGAARGHERVAAVTLGTGVGSAFLVGGRPVTSGSTVPPEGRADLLTIGGRPLEETVSTRALPAGVFASAARGDPRAAEVVRRTYCALGQALAPWLRRFEASVLVVGGGISAAWELIAGPLREGLALDLPVVRSADTERSALLGAANGPPPTGVEDGPPD